MFDCTLATCTLRYVICAKYESLLYFYLRWLDWIFLRGYLPSLIINYVAVNKDMEKKVIITISYKDENFL